MSEPWTENSNSLYFTLADSGSYSAHFLTSYSHALLAFLSAAPKSEASVSSDQFPSSSSYYGLASSSFVFTVTYLCFLANSGLGLATGFDIVALGTDFSTAAKLGFNRPVCVYSFFASAVFRFAFPMNPPLTRSYDVSLRKSASGFEFFEIEADYRFAVPKVVFMLSLGLYAF